MSEENPNSWYIEIDHSSYYRWMPVKVKDLNYNEDGEITDLVIDATWPGFVLRRTVVPEATTTTTSVDVKSLSETNIERAAAGLGPRSNITNLVNHLSDGPWPKHFPLESITAIRCDNAKVEARLNAHFLEVD